MPAPLDRPDVALRRFRPGDVSLLYEAARESIAEIYPWMAWCHPEYAESDSTGWVLSRDAAWQNGTEYSFVVHDPGTGAFLGGTGLNQINWAYRHANLGYWIRTSRTRRGVASAATRLVARYGFEELGLVRCEIVVAVGNLASVRAAEKSGATYEGVLRNRLMLHGKPVDAHMYSLIPADLGL